MGEDRKGVRGWWGKRRLQGKRRENRRGTGGIRRERKGKEKWGKRLENTEDKQSLHQVSILFK